MSLNKILRGTGVALVTPFKENFDVDYNALEKLLDHVIAGGCNYVVTLGTTGETPTLSSEEKISIINFTHEIVKDRIPVVVGIGGNSTEAVVADLKKYPLDKATAVLTASPYYNKPSQEGIFLHYKTVGEKSTKPVILYNVPGRTGSNMTATTTLRLAKEAKNIAGMKEASGNLVQCMHILKDKPQDFLLVSGDDHLTLPLIACGMQGVISVAANCFTKDFCKMVDYALEGDFEKAKPLHYKCLEGNDLLFAENNPAGAKAFLSEMGILKNVLRLPLVPLSKDLHEKVKKYLSDF
ncbi:4-hydroxy-tetrahydrodipicolinate synthase [soil metagenome]